jgi:hypothetical protein
MLQEHISALMIEQQKLREQAKRCKKEAEVYVEQLTELIENWEHPAADVNMTTSTEAAGGCGVHATDQSVPDITQTEPAGLPDASAGQPQPKTETQMLAAYRRTLESAPISQLGISETLQGKLIEAGAENLWTLEQLRSEISLGKAKWPKGIGAAKVTQIEDAIMGWMSRNSASWDPMQGANDAAEAAADESRAAEVAESQPMAPAAPAVSSDIDDL